MWPPMGSGESSLQQPRDEGVLIGALSGRGAGKEKKRLERELDTLRRVSL